MKTVYFTFTTWDKGTAAAGSDRGPNGGRRTVLVRRTVGRTVRSEDKVIDLNNWRSDSPDEFREKTDGPGPGRGETGWDERMDEPPEFVRRPRGSRRSMPAAELVSTLGVAAAALALILRVLTF